MCNMKNCKNCEKPYFKGFEPYKEQKSQLISNIDQEEQIRKEIRKELEDI